MSSLKQKTVFGIVWSFIDQFVNIGIAFIVGLILARLLSPREFGLIGMVVIFIAISEVFVNSGFNSALIRKKNCTDKDYSTVFYYNFSVAILLYFVLYISSPYIASFFKEPQLVLILRVLSFILLINSVSLIQSTILTKHVNFKLKAQISIISSSTSGLLAIIIAFYGYGVWSLVIQRVVRATLDSFLLWLWNTWRPKLIFSWKSFQELFGFGSKLLVSSLIAMLNQNIFHVVIGRFFSAESLGYYAKANEFKDLPSQGINNIIDRVSYPVLSSIQDEQERLKHNYKTLIRSTTYITFVLMLGMASVSKHMVTTLIGDQWLMTAEYLQMLCFVGMMYPLHALNLNMLKVSGRSDLFLKLEIIKTLLSIPVIVCGILWGIKTLILCLIIKSFIAYYLNSYWSGRFINYSMKEQIKDILPGFVIALTMGIIVMIIGWILPTNNVFTFIIQIISGAIITILISEIFKPKAYLELKHITIETIKQKT